MKKLTIGEIALQLKTIEDTQDPFIEQIKTDDRKGVQLLLNKWLKDTEQRIWAHKKFLEMSHYEIQYRKQGYKYIAGIDEVGRGPLAGPVVAAAVILPEDFYLTGIDDSKKLTEQKREDFFEVIMREAIATGIGIIEVEVIDEINIYEATKKAMFSSIANLKTQPDFLLVDAMKLDTPFPYEAIIKGDSKSISIAAASIVAKVTRDRMMKEIHEQSPEYGFSKNMGYGTKEHLEALKQHGVTLYHRKSFAPIKDYVAERK